MKKNICVIGAGVSGLCTIKELIEEGHQVTCFEQYEREGGVFYYSPHKGGVYDSTLLTISNYHMAFSAFPPANGEGRRFWTRSEYSDYLLAYARKFDLLKHIKFNHKVVKLKKNNLGNYVIQVKNSHSVVQDYEFDSIAICTGNNHHPNIPIFEGQQSFQGQIIHSYSYKNASPFINKRVLIVGIGETGADVAHEIANVAQSTMLSIRRYPSLAKRWYESHTADINTSRALYSLNLEKLNTVTQAVTEKAISSAPNPEIKILREWNAKVPRFFSQLHTKNTIFLQDIVEGRLQYNMTGIKSLQETRVLFNDDQFFEPDVIMCCTGYQDRFDFIDSNLPAANLTNVRDLYKHMIHPELGKSLAFIGFARPASGGAPAASEMQARYFALLQSEKRTLPDPDTLKQMTVTENAEEEAFFSGSPRVKSLVNWSHYMDAMAKLIDCQPQLLVWDLILSYKLWFGTQFSYQYRLRGPGAKPEEARKLIKKLSVGSGSLLFRKVLITWLAIKEKLTGESIESTI